MIGASAEGFSAPRKLFSTLDPATPATIFTVVHMSPMLPSYLVPLLSKSSTLPVKTASSGPFEPGVIYVAPPDHHLVIERRVISLSRGPRENRARPAIDVTFRSAAIAHGHSVIGVVLTGMLDDGTAGLFYIKRHGGITIVQDPQEAEFASMPANALAHENVDYKLPLDEIGPTLNRLAIATRFIDVGCTNRTTEPSSTEATMMRQDKHASNFTSYTCPECHGPISRVEDGSPTRFRCRVGHAYGLNSLADAQNEYSEQVIWSALQALEAKAEMEEHLRQEAESIGDDTQVVALKKRIDNTRRQIILLAEVLHLSGAEREVTAESPDPNQPHQS